MINAGVLYSPLSAMELDVNTDEQLFIFNCTASLKPNKNLVRASGLSMLTPLTLELKAA
jgi:hypothetical protein